MVEVGRRKEKTRRVAAFARSEVHVYSCVHSRHRIYIHSLTWTQAHMQTCAVCATGCVVNSCPEGFMLCALGGRVVVGGFSTPPPDTAFDTDRRQL